MITRALTLAAALAIANFAAACSEPAPPATPQVAPVVGRIPGQPPVAAELPIATPATIVVASSIPEAADINADNADAVAKALEAEIDADKDD